jgi:Zn-dependent protease with chaperone function
MMFNPRTAQDGLGVHGTRPGVEVPLSGRSEISGAPLRNLYIPDGRKEYFEEMSARPDVSIMSPPTDGGVRYYRTMFALNAKVAGAEVCGLLAYGAAVSVGLPYVIDNISLTIAATCAAFIATSGVAQSARTALAMHRLSRAPTEIRHLDVADRVARIAEELCRESGKVAPQIRVVDALGPYAGLLDRLVAKDILLVGAQMSREFSDRELRGIIAHELCHSNRTYGKLDTMRRFLNRVASPAILGASGVAAFGFLSNSVGPYFAGGVAVVVAGCAWTVAMKGIASISMFVSRQNELKTDLRAVRLSKDAEGYISALSKVSGMLPPKEFRTSNTGRLSHPTIESRVELLKDTFLFSSNASHVEVRRKSL